MDSYWETDLVHWSAGWRAVSGSESAPQDVVAWNGELPSAERVAVVCAPDAIPNVSDVAAAANRRVDSQRVLLSGDVEELDRGLGFPGESGMFDAPMGDFTRFEVDEWGKPVAYSTMSVQDTVAFVGPLVTLSANECDSAEILDPLVSSMANEAYLADAERLYTVVTQDEVESRRAQGWEPVAAVLRVA